MGDFNIDLLKSGSYTYTTDFIDAMFAHSFLPSINLPTRITEHSSTLIDNIFINCSNQSVQSGVIYYDVSDHLPIIASLNLHKTKSAELAIKKKTRDMNNANIQKIMHVAK